jgi:hypothetical protein
MDAGRNRSRMPSVRTRRPSRATLGLVAAATVFSALVARTAIPSEGASAVSTTATSNWGAIAASCGSGNPYYVTARWDYAASVRSDRAAILAFRDSAGDTWQDLHPDRYLVLATQSQVGTIWGLAYDWRRSVLYAGGFFKTDQHSVPSGAPDLGRVHRLDLRSGATTVLARLPAGRPRGEEWRAWDDDVARADRPNGSQPLVVDIEFRPNGDPILGLGNRKQMADFDTTRGDILPTVREAYGRWRVLTDPYGRPRRAGSQGARGGDVHDRVRERSRTRSGSPPGRGEQSSSLPPRTVGRGSAVDLPDDCVAGALQVTSG